MADVLPPLAAADAVAVIEPADEGVLAPGMMFRGESGVWGRVVEVLYGACPPQGLQRTRAWVDYGDRVACVDLGRGEMKMMGFRPAGPEIS